MMAKPASNLRLFVALYPPASTISAMSAALRSLDLPPHRLIPAEQVHITIQFIGDTPSAKLDATIESVQRAASGLQAFTLEPMRLITLPERGPARLIAAETTAHPMLLELHSRLVTRLARKARARDEDCFLPHVTLLRFRSPTRFTLDQTLKIEPFAVDRIVLMRSTLSSAGAMHHEVAACELERS